MATKNKAQSTPQDKAQGTAMPNAAAKKTTLPPSKPTAKNEPATPPQKEQPQQAVSAPATPKAVIRKGIYVSALVYIEGDMAPADNFANPATDALKAALNDALKGNRGNFTMTLKKVEVQNDVEQADDAEGIPKEGKFQF